MPGKDVGPSPAEEQHPNITSLTNALAQLRDNRDRCQNPAYAGYDALVRNFRTAAIKCFEVACGLSIVSLRGHLEEADSIAPDLETYRDLLRLAAERGRIDDPVAWFRF